MNKRTLSFLSLASLLALPVQAQVVPDITPRVDSAIERQVERVQERTARQVEQQAETVQNQTVERVQSQAERVQRRAAEQVQNQAGNVQRRAVEQVQNQAENAANRAQSRAERLQDIAERVSERLPENAAQVAQDRAGRGLAQALERGLTGAADALPERLGIRDIDGNEAFVEISITPNIRMVEYEWVMMLSETQRGQLTEEAPELMRFLSQTRPLAAADGVLLKFLVPPDLDEDDAVVQLVPEDLRDFIDRNHVYSAQQAAPVMGRPANTAEAGITALPLPMKAVCEAPVGIGIVDSMINHEHAAFAALNDRKGLITQNILDQSIVQPNGHGTAVAAVLTGEGPGLSPLLPTARIYSASVLHAQDDFHQGATVMNLLQALDWLLAQDLSVINMSLTGPPNRLLATTLETARQQGKVVVAAAGNEGPHAPPLYPAAYEGVVAVSAVERDGNIYHWSNQGAYIDFAALGVSVPTARGDGSFGPESGTSMSAPIISAFLACALESNGGNPEQALQWLKARAMDLGAPGHDPAYGYGLLHP